MTNRRNTIQKDLVKNAVYKMKRHVTTNEVYEFLKKEYPTIGKGTVYRNLALLTERGEILKLSIDGVSDRYDATTTPHLHFQCRHCNEVSDLSLHLDFDSMLKQASREFNGIIEGHNTFFYGVCPQCAKSKSRKNS